MIQTDVGDTRINNYLLEHGFQWISGNPVHHNIWSPPFFYPDPNAAAYTDILLGGAPFYWAFRFLGIQFDTSFQLWMIVVLGLNYLTMLFFLRRGLGLSVIASIGGAYLLAFASSRANQLCHQQLLPQFFAIIACLCLARVFGSASNRNPQHPSVRPWIVVFAISITLQLYASFYLGWFLCFGLVVFALLTICFKTTREELWLVLKKNWGVIFVSFAGGSLALAWMALHYLQGPLAARPWPEVATMIPRLESWINLGPFNWSWGWLRRYIDFQTLPMEHEHLIGLGIVTLCVIFMGLKPLRQNQWGKLLVLTSVIIFLGAMMYPHGLSPWQIVYKVMPGSGAIRAVTRIVLLLLIPASILLAMGLDRIQGKTLSFVLLVLICMEQVVTTPAYDKLAARADVAEIVSELPFESKSFYYVRLLEPGQKAGPEWRYELDAMWAALSANKPTVNGYSGQFPPEWGLWPSVFASRHELLANLDRLSCWGKSHGMAPDDVEIVLIGASKTEPTSPDVSFRKQYDAINLPSQIGTIKGLGRLAESRSPAGFLTFGPYVPLMKGDYSFEINYLGKSQDDSSSVGTWDVIIWRSGKSEEIQRGLLTGTGSDKIMGSFSVNDGCPPVTLEIRTYYYGKGTLQVDNIILFRDQVFLP